MTILNKEKVIWQIGDQSIKISAVDEHTVLFEQVQQFRELKASLVFTMMHDLAAYFGKRIKIEDIPLACPNCGGEVFAFVRSGKYLKKECESCGVSGPLVSCYDGFSGEPVADLAWRKLFYPDTVEQDKKPITIEEELARR